MFKEVLKPILIKQFLSWASLPMTGFWGKIWYKLAEKLITNIIFPAFDALIAEGFLFIRKKELEAKLKKYKEATTDEEFDDTFDDLIAGSKLQ